MSVVRDWRGGENRTSIKDRQDLLLASPNITAPELKVPAVFFPPVPGSSVRKVTCNCFSNCGRQKVVDHDKRDRLCALILLSQVVHLSVKLMKALLNGFLKSYVIKRITNHPLPTVDSGEPRATS